MLFFLFCFISWLHPLSPPEKSTPIVSEEILQKNLPVKLTIPTIQASASIEPVGLTPDGAMDAPKDPEGAAWFSLGSLPGETGTAVIAGHYGWKDGKPALFDNLSELKKGDTVKVENDKGVIVSFLVREIKIYDSQADTEEIFNSTDGKSHLNLITCQGDWNKSTKNYSERLVVFTDKE